MTPPPAARAPSCDEGGRAHEHHVRRLSFQPGSGKMSSAAADALGITTVGLRWRFWTAAALMETFWPLASNWIGPPTMTWWSILILRNASISASGLVDLASSQAWAAISMASKVKPPLRSSWSLGNFAACCFSSDCVIADLGSSHGTLEMWNSPYLPIVFRKSCSRSEEGRVGKERRTRGWPKHENKQ